MRTTYFFASKRTFSVRILKSYNILLSSQIVRSKYFLTFEKFPLLYKVYGFIYAYLLA